MCAADYNYSLSGCEPLCATVSGSRAGLTLSEFMESIIFTACDAADGIVDGRWAKNVSKAVRDKKKVQKKKPREATSAGEVLNAPVVEKPQEPMTADQVVMAVYRFVTDRLKPLITRASLNSFRSSVLGAPMLIKVLADLAPLHAQLFQRFATRRNDLVRVQLPQFLKLATTMMGGDCPPSTEQATDAFSHALHLSLYIPSASKALNAAEFQDALLYLALTITREKHGQSMSSGLSTDDSRPTVSAIISAVERPISGGNRKVWLEAVRACLTISTSIWRPAPMEIVEKPDNSGIPTNRRNSILDPSPHAVAAQAAAETHSHANAATTVQAGIRGRRVRKQSLALRDQTAPQDLLSGLAAPAAHAPSADHAQETSHRGAHRG